MKRSRDTISHHQASLRIENFLHAVPTSSKVSSGTSGLSPYWQAKKSIGTYTAQEAQRLSDLGIEARMRVKISDHYEALVTGQSGMPPSEPLRFLVTARDEEVVDLSGESDPSSQMLFSPIPGLLHKYEMALIHVVNTCSAHCRYCYRLDFFSGKTGKKIAKIPDVISYIRAHNKRQLQTSEANPIREVLLSGGDPMVLTNAKLASWLGHLAEAGISQIRIGTKELAFRPQRFDEALFSMLDDFHHFYPNVRLVFAVHFSHPDEFLQRDEYGDYIETAKGINQWIEAVELPVNQLSKRRNFISLENQTPIIKEINDSSNVIERLQRQLYHKGIGNHYFFQCRRIEGHRAFALPVERTLQIVNDSQRSLSGVECHARLVMSTQRGKIEIVGEAGDQIVFRLLRDSNGGAQKGAIAIAQRNPEAVWIDDYLDRIISDPQTVLK